MDRRSGLREAASASWLPWLVGRSIALGALALARFETSHLEIGNTKALADAHAGLWSWDAGWYSEIAAHGYRAAGEVSLRFFPLLPLVTTAVHHVTALPVDAVTAIIANASALAGSAMLYLLTLRELPDAGVARSAVWLFNLAPAAFVLTMGYSDPILILLAVSCFYLLRSDRWLWAALIGYLAGTARPVGCLLVVPAVCEALRGVRAADWRERWSRLVASAAPALGLLTYLAWTSAVFGTLTKPLTLQTDPTRHGGLTDPFVTVYRDAVNVLHGHHVGTALHLPWVALTIGLLVLTFRTLPVSYGLYALAIVGTAASGSNLDSFERYALSAFPVLIAGATLLRSRRVEVAVLVLIAAAMFGYAVLAFLGAYVP